MNLKHIEELAKDDNLINGVIASSFMQYDVDSFDWYGDDKPKYYKGLTDTEKIKLISSAYWYWLKDSSNAPLGIICDCVMAHQKQILSDTLLKWEFFDYLADML